MDQLSRRAVLRLLGVSSLGISASCASISFVGSEESKYDPGTLVVTNHHSLAYLVSVSVTGPKPMGSNNSSTKSLHGIETAIKGQIPVDAGETTVYPDFLSGSVLYTVKMWLGTTGATIPPAATEHDNVVEAKFRPTAAEPSDARGSFLTAQIR